MMAFWRHGYNATTFRVLEDATGVGAKGLTNVLGDKDAIFENALGIYHERARLVLADIFKVPNLDAIKAFLSMLAAPTGSKEDISNAGCLMVSTIYEADRITPEARLKVEAFRDLLVDTFRSALEADGVERADEKAEFLLGVVWAGHNQIRLRRSSEAARDIVKVGIETIDSWRTS